MNKYLLNKDLVNLPNGYEDDRGIIQPLFLNMKSASLIVSPNTWKQIIIIKLIGFFIVLKGSFEYYFKKTNSVTRL